MIQQITGTILAGAGVIFLFLGSLGILRMPDGYTRIQAGTKASTLGSILTLAGIAVLMPEWWPKLLILILFVLATNPVSSHVLARAAYKSGTAKGRFDYDAMKERNDGND